MDEDDVRKAVLSFPAGSAMGGPDGLRPHHLRDMVLCKETGPELITALTGFINLVLAGRCPTGVAPVFFGGRLMALSKKMAVFRELPGLNVKFLFPSPEKAHPCAEPRRLTYYA